jgi:hypothetical protein
MNTNTHTHRLCWVSEGKQGSMDGGDFESYEAAMASSEDWLQELLRQCGEDWQRESILAGHFYVERFED